MFLFFLAFASCFLERMTSKTNFSVTNYIFSDQNTVHFIQTELKEFFGSSVTARPAQGFKTMITVYKGDPATGGSVFHNDVKSGETNSFFFTTPNRDQYFIVFSAVTDDLLEPEPSTSLGVDIKIYSGEANMPKIVSTNDVEVIKAENLIEKVLNFIKQNIRIQEIEEEDDASSRKIYERIMMKVLFVLLLKIAGTGLTMYYSSRKTKSFYASQGFVADK